MNCLIILLLLCCCGKSNNNVCCEHSHDCKDKCNEREKCNEWENRCEEVRCDRECDSVRADNRNYDNNRTDDRGCDSRRESDFCDDYDRDRRENSWKEYSDFRRSDSCGCDGK